MAPAPAARPVHPADGHDLLRVHGARENNLRDVSVELPKRRLTVFTGVSGSGKSSLVFATIAAESQRLVDETYSAFLQGLMPGRAVVVTSANGNEVIIHKALGGHFQADVEVNGKTTRMLVDTGASSVVLAYDDAENLGIDTNTLSYSIPVMTANGRAMAAPVRLDEIAIGPISRRNIRAMVAAEGRLNESLLGMSFLSTLGSLQMQTDELRLRD